MSEFLRLTLQSSADVALARQLARDVAKASGMLALDQTKLATLVSGMARRTCDSPGHGEVVFSTETTAGGRTSVVVTVLDASATGTRAPGTVSTTTAQTCDDLHPDGRDPQVLLAHDDETTPAGARYVSAAMALSEDAAADPGLLDRLAALGPRVAPGEPSLGVPPLGDLGRVVAAQAQELEHLNRLVARANQAQDAVNQELALTNRGVIDLVAELVAANESLVVSGVAMTQLADQQSALADLGHRAVVSRDLEQLAVSLVGVLRRVLSIQGVGILRFAMGGPRLELVAGEGCDPEQPGCGVLTGDQLERLRRPASSVSDPARNTGDFFLEVPGGARSCAVVTVQTPAGPWGVLVASDPEKDRFSTTAVTFLEAAVSLFAFSIARMASEEANKHSACHDPLTGLPNRSQLLEDLGRMIADDPGPGDDTDPAREGGDVGDTAHDRSGRALAVIFIDIDGFKQVNDTLGHAAGDHVLVAASERLRTRARPDDVLARLGGDEFVVLCQGGGSIAPAIAQRLLTAFDEPFDIAGQEMFLSASAGIAAAEAGATSQQVLADADIAMYHAKKIPGSASVAFHPDMRALAETQSRLHNELRRAQERGELRAVYQPIVDLHDGRVRGVEALVRWRHPELGDVPADVAVAAAERIGMAWELTCWMAREAATTVRSWNTANPDHPPLRLALNFTPLLLDDPRHMGVFASHVTDAGLPIGLLDVELTETAFADPSPDVLTSISELRRMGVRLAMDDFGTGYSSLFALSKLPLDILKIDRSFVTPLDRGGDSLLVSAMTFIARGRSLESIAEGIETEGQLAAVIAAGCDLGQGYLFARPLELEQLHCLVASEPEFGELVRRASPSRRSREGAHNE